MTNQESFMRLFIQKNCDKLQHLRRIIVYLRNFTLKLTIKRKLRKLILVRNLFPKRNYLSKDVKFNQILNKMYNMRNLIKILSNKLKYNQISLIINLTISFLNQMIRFKVKFKMFLIRKSRNMVNNCCNKRKLAKILLKTILLLNNIIKLLLLNNK